MSCPSVDTVLRGEAGDHALHCEECRALLEAWAEVDQTLSEAFRDIPSPAGLTARARAQALAEARLRRPTWIPEILDFVGWAAVLTLAAVLLPRYIPLLQTAITR